MAAGSTVQLAAPNLRACVPEPLQGNLDPKVERVMEVARYLHLNPVRIGRLGLGKAEAVRHFQVRLKD